LPVYPPPLLWRWLCRPAPSLVGFVGGFAVQWWVGVGGGGVGRGGAPRWRHGGPGRPGSRPGPPDALRARTRSVTAYHHLSPRFCGWVRRPVVGGCGRWWRGAPVSIGETQVRVSRLLPTPRTWGAILPGPDRMWPFGIIGVATRYILTGACALEREFCLLVLNSVTSTKQSINSTRIPWGIGLNPAP
jgi:hypothetical protein